MTNFNLDDIVITPGNMPPKKLVILMHGYGTDNTSFKNIGEFFAEIVDGAVVHIPNGFEPCESGSGGRQWFSLEGWGVTDWRPRLKGASTKANIYIDGLLVKYGLTDKDVILVGFSQGTMMALQCGLIKGVGAIVGFSGTLVDSSILHDLQKIPNVLLVHGDADTVLPVASVYEAVDAFKANGFDVKLSVIPRLEHHIDSRALACAKSFISSLDD